MNIKLGDIHIKSWKIGDSLFPDWWFEDGEDMDDKNIDSKEVVLKPNIEYTIKVEYPLRNPCSVKFVTGKTGMTREKLIDKICKLYRNIYKIEDGSSKVKAGLIPGMLNRNFTDGKFGIWGHDICDLVLVNCDIGKKNVISLGVDS